MDVTGDVQFDDRCVGRAGASDTLVRDQSGDGSEPMPSVASAWPAWAVTATMRAIASANPNNTRAVESRISSPDGERISGDIEHDTGAITPR